MKCAPLALAVVMFGVSPVAAQQLSLQIQDGKVTLDAVNVPARQILAEWARVGGTKVVGAEKIVGPPLTLKLVATPERRALDIVLGSVAGFMAAERQATAAPGASVYDRILILATSTAPAQANASRPGQGGQSSGVGAQRRVPPRPPNLPQPADDDSNDSKEADEQDAANQQNQNPPVFSFPGAPGSQNANAPVFVPINQGNSGIFGAPAQQPGATYTGASQPGMTAPPVITLQPNANGQPTIFNFVPNGQGVPQAVPGFAPGAPTPGMIQQPPAQPQPPPNRPPR